MRENGTYATSGRVGYWRLVAERLLPAAALVATAFLAACGGGRQIGTKVQGAAVSATTTTTPGPMRIQDLGPLKAARYYPDGGIRLLPPPTTRPEAVSAETASRVCGKTADCPNASGTAELASFSDDQYGTMSPDGKSVSHPFQNTLAWVLSWHGTDCGASGPPPPPGRPPDTALATLCDTVVFVEAAKGQYLIEYIGAPASSTPGTTLPPAASGKPLMAPGKRITAASPPTSPPTTPPPRPSP